MAAVTADRNRLSTLKGVERYPGLIQVGLPVEGGKERGRQGVGGREEGGREEGGGERREGGEGEL